MTKEQSLPEQVPWEVEVPHGEPPAPQPLPASIFDVAHEGPMLQEHSAVPLSPEGSRDERRRLRRVPYDEKVALWQRGPEGKALCWPAWGLNLSSGGIRLIVNRLFTKGEQVGVQLQPEKRAFPGRVAWVKTQPDGCIVGVCFTTPP